MKAGFFEYFYPFWAGWCCYQLVNSIRTRGVWWHIALDSLCVVAMLLCARWRFQRLTQRARVEPLLRGEWLQ